MDKYLERPALGYLLLSGIFFSIILYLQYISAHPEPTNMPLSYIESVTIYIVCATSSVAFFIAFQIEWALIKSQDHKNSRTSIDLERGSL